MEGAPLVSTEQLNAPYPERWTLLKDVMAWLYLEQPKKLPLKEVVQLMQKHYQFYASESQYKRQFGIWNLKRVLPTAKKEKISKVLETRAQQGKSSVVLHRGNVEVQKIRRYMKEQARRDIFIFANKSNEAVGVENLSGHALQCGNRVFMNWSMPAAILRFLKTKAIDHVSPYAAARTPMSDILVATPSSNSGPSPRNHPSPGGSLPQNNERSAMTIAAKDSLKISRAHLFVQKHHTDLLLGMDLQEQCITTEWLNQFWQYSFKTARTWGRGPRVWDASSLRFNDFSKARIGSLSGTPATNFESSGQHSHHQSPKYMSSDGVDVQKPSHLCRWVIHVRPIRYMRVPSPAPVEEIVDAEDEGSWTPWATPASIQDFANHLQENLESNNFSTIDTKDLPISSGQIARAAKRSPEQIIEEAFGFSIMARNVDLIYDMFEDMVDVENFSLHELYPLHLASSYLDGSNTCCGVFSAIVQLMPTGDSSVRKLYINHLGHTVLDNLMIAILKGHTSCTPIIVDEAFKKESRFAGEEVDICGRWDADSDCIRHLNASGTPTIPRNWKHMFCHTSVQAITHCIGTLFSSYWAPDINTPSGLFLRRCPDETCGLKLQLRPLHTLVVTAVYLAQLGSDGENLFGMLACLLCLLGKGANPLLKSDVSWKALLSSDNGQQCSHSELDPLELALKVPWHITSKWPEERIIGWKIFCTTLKLSQNEWNPPPHPEPTAYTSRSPEGNFRSIYGVFLEGEDRDIAVTELSVMDIEEESEHGKEDEDQDEDMDSDENDEDQDEDMDSDENDEFHEDEQGVPAYCPDHDETPYQQNFFGKNKSLATLWAAVQTELLTYRRLAEGDPWISSNFDMKSVLESLENGEELSIGLVSEGMMKPFCRCGIFCDSDDPVCLRVEEASAYYFSNLEDYSRTSFLEAEISRVETWDPKNWG